MPKIKPLSRKEYLKKLKKFGFSDIQRGGDHDFLVTDNAKIKLPNVHAQKDIPVFIIQKTIKVLGIDRNKWIN